MVLDGQKAPVELVGTVSRLTFVNTENGFTVAEVESEKLDFVAVGVMPPLKLGDTAVFTGNWVEHKEYGPQFQTTLVRIMLPSTDEAIETYLAAGAIPGIGPVLAKRLVQKFGADTLRIIAEEPNRLISVKGISAKTAHKLNRSFQASQAWQELALLLTPLGVGIARVQRIYRQLGAEAIRIVKDNPYLLSVKVEGIGFETADKLAGKLGFSGQHPERVRAGVLQVLRTMLARGDTWMPERDLINRTGHLLGLSETTVREVMSRDDFYLERTRVFTGNGETGACLDVNWQLATFAAARINELLGERTHIYHSQGLRNQEQGLVSEQPAEYGRHQEQRLVAGDIDSAAAELGLELAPEQKQALLMALTGSFSILTGGPGTGKTTIVKVLVHILRTQKAKILLAAPTGRAARRLAEICRAEAKTIHRLLQLQPLADDFSQQSIWQQAEQLTGDYLIVDECSMLDITLFSHLLAAIPAGMRVLLIGDSDQLPSVGPGQVLRDLLAQERIPRTTLVRIFRQEEVNLIVRNAHRIRVGKSLFLDQSLESSFLLVLRNSETEMAQAVFKLVRDILPQKYGIDTETELQILTAVRRGAAGVTALNKTLQEIARGGPDFTAIHRFQPYAVGDKVIQTRNNYELEYLLVADGTRGLGIMNGERGIVTELNLADKTMKVLFEEERLAEIADDDFEDLELAYAITIHKSQGSEYPNVILVIPHNTPTFLTRNLLYTGVTRASQRLFLVCKDYTLKMMIRNEIALNRRTLLSALLRQPPLYKLSSDYNIAVNGRAITLNESAGFQGRQRP
jgi:exodeoxyribonuclease V alpha subunit